SLASVAILAKDTLPTVRNYAEAVIYAVCPLVLVMCLVSGGDAAKKILAMYGKTIGWVSLWPVLFAMINGLSMIRLSHVMHSMSLQNGVPFGMAAKFGSTLIDEQALLGYMVIIVPVLAWGILNVASAGLNGAFSMLTGAVTGSAQQIGGQQAQGNESIGNVHMDSSSIDSASRNVTSANKFDNTVQSRTGAMNVDTGTGSAFTNFSNGLIARTDYQNSLGVSATSQQAFERSLGTDSSTGVSSNQTSSAFSGREQVASSTSSVSNSQERGTTQRVGDESSSGTRGSTSQSGERRTSVDQQYGVDQSHSVEGQTSAGGKISGMLGGVFEKSFGEDVPAGTGSPNPGGGRQAPGGKGAPGPANPAANSPLFNQAEEDKLARKAESLGKSPQEVQAIRDAYRSKVTAADYATGGGTGKGKSSARIGLDISGEGGYMRFWRNSDAEKFVDQYGSLGAFSENDQYTREGSQIHTDSTGMDSGQHTRTDRSASLTDQASSGSRVAADLSRSADVRQRGSTQTVSRVDTSTNLMTPENLQKVAARNGMRYSQLMTLSGDDLARLVSEDASMRDIVSRNSTLPTTARDGTALPTRQADVVRQNRLDRSSVGSGVAAAYQGFEGAVGPANTSALNVSTPVPEVVSDAQQRVDAMKQRVSTDAAAPIAQVNAHVDPSSDNKPLMTPERAPARPLPLPAPPPPPAAGAQASASPGRAPFDAWRSDITAPPLQSGSAAPPAAVERFLHSGAATTENMPADARMASPKPSSGSSAAHLSESDFRIVTLDAGSAGPSPEGDRQPTQPSSGSPARVASSPMQPMTAKAVNFGAPFAPGRVPVGDLTGDASIPGRPLGASHSAQPMTPGTPGASSFPSATAGPRKLAPSRPSLPAGGGEIGSTEGDLGKARSTPAGIGSLNEKARSEKPDPSAGNAAGAPSQTPMAPIERAESSEQSVAGSNQAMANGPATSPSALPSQRQLARGAGNSNGEPSVAPNRQADTNDK
ncbi:conjugal transfer protein TraG N-terminal domain-containing protein, partial [Burkholderia gladioli]